MRSVLHGHATRTHGSDGVIEALGDFAMRIARATYPGESEKIGKGGEPTGPIWRVAGGGVRGTWLGRAWVRGRADRTPRIIDTVSDARGGVTPLAPLAPDEMFFFFFFFFFFCIQFI
jgi:hypothetical protein